MRAEFFAILTSLAVGLGACSSDSSSNGTPQQDSGTAADSGSTPTDSGANTTDSGQDSGPTITPIGCTDAELEAPSANFTGTANGGQGAGGADISFPTVVSPAQYTNRCVKIKVGQQVTFAGSFENHPLAAIGGDTPSPIPALTNVSPGSGTITVTFTTAGTFGFRCQFHPSMMFGAVRVIP